MRKAVSSRAPDCQVKKYVGTSFDDVKIVADNIDDVITVADNITKIDDVMPHVGDIATVADNITDVTEVADNMADINTLAPLSTDIHTVADNIDAVKNTSDNMAAVIDAPNQAQIAIDSANAAKVSENNAKQSETNAKTSETNASTSEQNAAASAQAAQASASAASASEQAAKLSETNAKTSETNAATSATKALASENAAKLSESNAKTSETNAAASALAASNSESAAASSETNAGISETNAKDSEIKADNSEQVATTKAKEASDSATAAANSATDANQAKVEAVTAKDAAEAAQMKSETIYEAFMKGAVYRGAWNPKTQAYPDPKGINSHWDVLLDSGTTYVDFDSKRWYSGDRLIWSEPDKQFFHVNRVAGVLSVNGKTGAVSITAEDINAIDSIPAVVPDVDALFAQDKHVIDHTNASVPGLAGQRALLHIQNGKGGFQLAARSIGSEIHVRAANSSDGTIYPWERLYTTGFRPTPADIGAAPDDYSPSWSQIGLVKGTLYRAVGRTSGSEASDWDTLDSAGIYARLVNNTSTHGPVGGTGYHYLENFTYGSTGNTTQLAIPYGISGKNGRIALRSRYNNVWNPWEYLYTTENKPTLTELGALGKTEASVGIDNPTNSTTSTDWDNFIPDDMKLTTTSINSPTGNAAHGFFLPHQGGFGTNFGTQFVARDNNYFLRSREDDAWNPWVEIYTSGNKPTASDINAVSKSGDTMTGDLEIQTRLRVSSVVNKDNADQGLVMYGGGTTRLGGSGSNSMYFCPRGSSKNASADYASELDKNGSFYVNSAGATPLSLYRVGTSAPNVNIKFQGKNTDGSGLGEDWYVGSFTNGAGFGIGKNGDLSTSSNRILEVGDNGIGVRAKGSTSGMTIYSDDPALLFYRNGIAKSGYIGMSGDSDDAFYVRPPSTGSRFKVYHQGNKPRADEVASNTVSLDGLDSTKFYPLVFDAKNTAAYVCHMDLSVGSGAGSSPYNNNTLVGFARGGGWSDANAYWNLALDKYSNSETNIHSMWEGTQGFTGIVIYVRGGQSINLRSNSHARVYTTSFSSGGSVFKAGVTDPSASGNVTNGGRLATFVESGRYTSPEVTKFITSGVKISPKQLHGTFKIETDANFDSMIRMAEDNAKHGAFLHYHGSDSNEFRIGTRNNDVDAIAMRIYRGSNSVHIEDELLAKDLNISLNGGLKLSGRRAIRSTDSNWLRLNDEGAFSSGIYCGTSLLRTDGYMTVGDWSGGNKVVKITDGFYDSTWGNNGTAAYSFKVSDSVGAHWALASYYNGSNIRSGIQILSNAEGRMRFYTNRRTKYVEINGGNVVAQGNVTGYSDARVKTDLEVIPNALDKVSQLTGYTYKRTDMDSDERKVGLIAQDVEKVLPEAVVTVDREDLGIDDFKTLDYGNMVALLVESIKELKAEVDSLKKELGR